MSTIVIKKVEVVDAHSSWNGQIVDVLIEDGVIQKISKEALIGQTYVEGKALKLSQGWCDMRAFSADPGFESKEDFNSFTKSAAKGGYTAVVCMPNTVPSIDNKENVHYVISKTQHALTKVYPAGSLTLKNKGEELAEIIDMHHAGAIAFSDGNAPVWHSDVLLRGLLYLKPLNGLLMVHAEDKYLSAHGQMNESLVSTTLGLKGMPKLAEEIIVQRDLGILEYTEGKLHFSHISSPRSLEFIKAAKKKGLQVTCDIAAYQLVLDESLLTSFDTNYKLNPPLRNKKDIESFWKYLSDGTIDAIVSDHQPHDAECKNLEFDLADFGISNIETAFSVIYTHNKKLSVSELMEKFSTAPRRILNLPTLKLEEGEIANITVFDAEEAWVPTSKNLLSKSKNNPFMNATLQGKVKAVFNEAHYQIFS
jgi:dihydroorotase